MIKELKLLLWKLYSACRSRKYGLMTSTSFLRPGVKVYCKRNLFMEEHTNINGGTIMNTRAKVVFKKYSGSAFGLTIITGNHMSVPGKHHKMVTDKLKDELDTLKEYDKDVIVGEDVWLAANVTILAGVTIGRGSIVGAGSLVRTDVPPYSIVIGNPAKVVGFRFTPSIIVQHEEELYPEEERLPEDLLEENYKKYFVSKIKDIQQFLSL